ncbi:MAG: hypothetical protein JOY66_16085 [Acetobacteraceae bacterium]|nr:hypothetical protein [Acetobacteraceae bacterium]
MVEVAGLSLRAALSPARWLMPGATVGLAIRSEDIALAPQAERHAPELNAISVAVSEVRAEGVGWRVRCAGPVGLDILLPRWSARPSPGEAVAALVRPVAVHVFEAGSGALSAD